MFKLLLFTLFSLILTISCTDVNIINNNNNKLLQKYNILSVQVANNNGSFVVNSDNVNAGETSGENFIINCDLIANKLQNFNDSNEFFYAINYVISNKSFTDYLIPSLDAFSYSKDGIMSPCDVMKSTATAGGNTRPYSYSAINIYDDEFDYNSLRQVTIDDYYISSSYFGGSSVGFINDGIRKQLFTWGTSYNPGLHGGCCKAGAIWTDDSAWSQSYTIFAYTINSRFIYLNYFNASINEANVVFNSATSDLFGRVKDEFIGVSCAWSYVLAQSSNVKPVQFSSTCQLSAVSITVPQKGVNYTVTMTISNLNSTIDKIFWPDSVKTKTFDLFVSGVTTTTAANPTTTTTTAPIPKSLSVAKNDGSVAVSDVENGMKIGSNYFTACQNVTDTMTSAIYYVVKTDNRYTDYLIPMYNPGTQALANACDVLSGHTIFYNYSTSRFYYYSKIAPTEADFDILSLRRVEILDSEAIYYMGGSEENFIADDSERNRLTYWGNIYNSPGGCCKQNGNPNNNSYWSLPYTIDVYYFGDSKYVYLNKIYFINTAEDFNLNGGVTDLYGQSNEHLKITCLWKYTSKMNGNNPIFVSDKCLLEQAHLNGMERSKMYTLNVVITNNKNNQIMYEFWPSGSGLSKSININVPNAPSTTTIAPSDNTNNKSSKKMSVGLIIGIVVIVVVVVISIILLIIFHNTIKRKLFGQSNNINEETNNKNKI